MKFQPLAGGVFLLLVSGTLSAQTVFTNGIDVAGQRVQGVGLIDLANTNLPVSTMTPSVGQLAGIDPITGATLTNTAYLFPLRPAWLETDAIYAHSSNGLTLYDSANNAVLTIRQGALSGNGSALSNLDAGAITSGQLSTAIMPTGGVWNASGLMISNAVLTGGGDWGTYPAISNIENSVNLFGSPFNLNVSGNPGGFLMMGKEGFTGWWDPTPTLNLTGDGTQGNMFLGMLANAGQSLSFVDSTWGATYGNIVAGWVGCAEHTGDIHVEGQGNFVHGNIYMGNVSIMGSANQLAAQSGYGNRLEIYGIANAVQLFNDSTDTYITGYANTLNATYSAAHITADAALVVASGATCEITGSGSLTVGGGTLQNTHNYSAVIGVDLSSEEENSLRVRKTIQDALRLRPAGATPPDLQEGDVWMDGTAHRLKLYDGTDIQDVGSFGGGTVSIERRITNATCKAKRGVTRIAECTRGGDLGRQPVGIFRQPARPSARLGCPAGRWPGAS